MAQQQRKIIVTTLYFILFFYFIVMNPPKIQQIQFENSCLVLKGKRYCAYCISPPLNIKPSKPLQLNLKSLNMSLNMLLSCKRYTCKQTLQFIDYDKLDLGLQQFPQMNEYLRELGLNVITNDKLIIPEKKSFIGYTKIEIQKNNEAKIQPIKYETNNFESYNFKIATVLFVISLTILAYINLTINHFKDHKLYYFVQFIILVLLYISIYLQKFYDEDTHIKSQYLFVIVHSLIMYFFLHNLNFQIEIGIAIAILNFIVEIIKIKYHISKQPSHMLLTIIGMVTVIYLIAQQGKNPLSSIQLATLIGFLAYMYCFVIYDKTQQNQYFISMVTIINGILGIVQIYSVDQQGETKKKSGSSITQQKIKQFEEIQQQHQDNTVMQRNE